MMQIDVWADITCPWCYLSIRHLRSALGGFAHRDHVRIHLHAFYLDPELDEPWPKSHAHYMTSVHESEFSAVTESYTRLENLGRAEGLRFDFDRLIVAPPARAFALLSYAHEEDLYRETLTSPDTYALKAYEAVARAHFSMGLNIADPEVLVGCAQDIGLDPREVLSAVDNDASTHASLADYQMALAMGITAVPTMLIDNRFLVPGMQTHTAVSNMLNTAWTAANEGETP